MSTLTLSVVFAGQQLIKLSLMQLPVLSPTFILFFETAISRPPRLHPYILTIS
jgi:hypothetical protein